MDLLPDSSSFWSCGGVFSFDQIGGRLTFVPVPFRGRLVYRVSEAHFFILRGPMVLGTTTGQGMYWPRLPGGVHRMILDFGDAHYDSGLDELQTQTQDLRITLHHHEGFCSTNLYLHAASVTGTGGPTLP